jgi:hypothetical protein
VTTAPDTWQIPATAQAILAARIDRLRPRTSASPGRRRHRRRTCRSRCCKRSRSCPRRTCAGDLSHLQAAEFCTRRASSRI